MTKSSIHKVLSFSLAVFMLMSSIGFTLSVHYCQKKMSGISLFGISQCCHDESGNDQCHSTSHTSDSDSKAGCCHDESFDIEKSDNHTTLPNLTSNQKFSPDCIFPLLITCMFESNIERINYSHRPYKPPLPDGDFQILFQTFLI